MKKHDVILYKDRFYLVRAVSNTALTISLIKKDDTVSKKQIAISKTANIEVVKGAKRQLKVTLPQDAKSEIRYKQGIDEAREALRSFRRTQSKKTKSYLCHTIFMACTHRRTKRAIDVFLKEIRLKRSDKVYRMLARYIIHDYNERKLVISNLTDYALDVVINRHQKNWDFWHGNHEVLDKALKKDFGLYQRAKTQREAAIKKLKAEQELPA